MTAWISRRSTAAALSSLLLLTAVGAAVIASAQPAAAQSAATKAMVDAAKARGAIGEQGDGFLGFVAPSTDPALAAAVAEINQGRTAVYREIAAKTNVKVREILVRAAGIHDEKGRKVTPVQPDP